MTGRKQESVMAQVRIQRVKRIDSAAVELEVDLFVRRLYYGLEKERLYLSQFTDKSHAKSIREIQKLLYSDKAVLLKKLKAMLNAI